MIRMTESRFESTAGQKTPQWILSEWGMRGTELTALGFTDIRLDVTGFGHTADGYQRTGSRTSQRQTMWPL